MDFTITAFFPTTPEVLYRTWLDADGHSAMTGGEAEITDEEGDPFHCWDGYIWGKNLKLEPNKLIRQSWKTTDFKDDQDYSIVELIFIEKPDGTELILNHSQLSDEDKHYIKGWEDHYFTPMKTYFAHAKNSE